MKTTVGLFLLFFCSSVLAISPQFWEKNTQQQFAEGDPQSVSINSEGEVVLAPQLKLHYEGSDPIIWKIRADTVGNIYLATGNEGKIIKIDTFGKPMVYLDTNELEVQAMVLDANNYLYAATSPDGKIYKVRADGTSSVFFDPEDKYIWSLALDNEGNLYAGTGDQGKIYKIDPQGKGTVLIDTNENNITALQWGHDGKLLAGSDRNGILYSVDSTGKAFVLFDSDLQQITSLFTTPEGDTYFSAITGIVPAPSNRPAQEVTRPPQPSSTGEPETEFGGGEDAEVVASVDVSVSAALPVQQAPPRLTGASQLYRISPEGFTELVYNAAEDQILDISGFRDDMILLSTGKKAKLISVDPNKKSTILLKAPEEQMTSLLMTGDKIWVATANPGNVYQLVENHSASGVYYSDVKDTQTTSTWGQISWKADIPEGTTLSLSSRSGNTRTPDDTWSSWYNAGVNPEGSKIQNPRSRFIQWKAEFNTTNPILSPVLRSVSLAYLQQNIRPDVLTINIHPAGVVYRRTPIYTQESFAGLSEVPGSDRDQPEVAGQGQQGFEFGGGLGKREIRKGYQTITWNAYDQNQDELRYDLAYRSDTDRNWKVLQRNVKDRVYAWDTQTLPDGTYTIKVTANDSGSNPKEYVLANSKESTPFDIDNSAPSIEVKSSTYDKGRFILEVRATDRFSAIRDMQYSIAPGEWVVVFPIDSINDSPTEDYRLELVNLPIEINTIILRCADRVRNAMTIKHALPR